MRSWRSKRKRTLLLGDLPFRHGGRAYLNDAAKDIFKAEDGSPFIGRAIHRQHFPTDNQACRPVYYRRRKEHSIYGIDLERACFHCR